MFFRVKSAGSHQYLQIVHSVRQGEKVRQQVFGTLGRLDELGVPLSSEPKRTLSLFLHGMDRDSPSVRDRFVEISTPSRRRM